MQNRAHSEAPEQRPVQHAELTGQLGEAGLYQSVKSGRKNSNGRVAANGSQLDYCCGFGCLFWDGYYPILGQYLVVAGLFAVSTERLVISHCERFGGATVCFIALVLA